MLKILSSLIIYLFVGGIFGYLTYLIVVTDLYKKSFRATFGLSLMWLGLIFNITYTGIMGWNFTPGSDLEALLDSITFVVQFIGFIAFYTGLNKVSNSK